MREVRSVRSPWTQLPRIPAGDYLKEYEKAHITRDRKELPGRAGRGVITDRANNRVGRQFFVAKGSAYRWSKLASEGPVGGADYEVSRVAARMRRRTILRSRPPGMQTSYRARISRSSPLCPSTVTGPLSLFLHHSRFQQLSPSRSRQPRSLPRFLASSLPRFLVS